MDVKITPASINKFFKDANGGEYLCISEVTPCCTLPYFLLKEFASPSIYPYNRFGQRLDHRLKEVLDITLNVEVVE